NQEVNRKKQNRRGGRSRRFEPRRAAGKQDHRKQKCEIRRFRRRGPRFLEDRGKKNRRVRVRQSCDREPWDQCKRRWRGNGALERRSEEHTSELQSHLNLVCRLLLEKKK